jgi:hypothetical protein
MSPLTGVISHRRRVIDPQEEEMFQQITAPTIGRRAGTLLAAALVMAATALALLAGPLPSAHAAWTNAFCTNAWLQPYGQNGDRCVMGEGYANHYNSFSVTTQDRAGCVAATGYYGEQVTSWSCAGSWGQQFIGLPNPAGSWYRGTIRNNNTGSAGGFSGGAYCNPEICV